MKAVTTTLFLLVLTVLGFLVFRGNDQAVEPRRSGPYLIQGGVVSYYDDVVNGADPKTFFVVPYLYLEKQKWCKAYAKDRRRVYLHADPIPGADPGTIICIPNQKAIDGRSMVYSDHTVPLIKDAENLFLQGKQVDLGVDAQSFEIPAEWSLSEPHVISFARDSNQLYFLTKSSIEVVEGADPGTFEYLRDGYGRDADRMYYYADVLDADYESFENIGWWYALDKDSVFFQGKKMLDVDRATFRVNNGNPVDKNYRFYYGKKNEDWGL